MQNYLNFLNALWAVSSEYRSSAWEWAKKTHFIVQCAIAYLLDYVYTNMNWSTGNLARLLKINGMKNAKHTEKVMRKFA